MKSKQEYIDTYRKIAENLGIVGDSAEILIQLLAESTYISEVENAVYMQEASLEKAALLNSKIQHCMNDMYSVFRGSCPRVILKFHPTKYFDLRPYDELIIGSGFKVYYLGYYGEGITEDKTEAVSSIPGFVYGTTSIYPGIHNNPEDPDYESVILIGLLAKEYYTSTYTTTSINSYYIDCTEENLSSDMWCKIEGQFYDVTREFSEHIIKKKVYDLTLPSFGSRLYVADLLRTGELDRSNVTTQENMRIEALWYKYSLLSDYNQAELKKLQVKGSIPVSFGSEFLGSEEVSPGVILLPESSRDTLSSIHYKANRDRYVNSIIRTNSDIGTVLEEAYPEKVMVGGTSYRFSSTQDSSKIELYYVPKGQTLNETEKKKFISDYRGYYVTDRIEIEEGNKYTAIFNLDLVLYQPDIETTQGIESILDTYKNKFNTNLESATEEIKSSISKISNIKQISGFTIDYISSLGQFLGDGSKKEMLQNLDIIYYDIKCQITSKIQTTGL